MNHDEETIRKFSFKVRWLLATSRVDWYSFTLESRIRQFGVWHLNIINDWTKSARQRQLNSNGWDFEL